MIMITASRLSPVFTLKFGFYFEIPSSKPFHDPNPVSRAYLLSSIFLNFLLDSRLKLSDV